MKFTQFETEECSRCRGTGKFSFCEMYADTCFKCRGQKVVLTARGLVAKNYLNELRTVSVSQIPIGSKIVVNSMSRRYFATVISICESGNKYMKEGQWHNYVEITTKHPKYGEHRLCTFPDVGTEVIDSNDAEKIKTAICFQETLTKSGSPRKRKVGA